MELKKIRVREAKLRDIGLFKKLWQAGIDEFTSGKGTTAFFEELFNKYVETDNGFVLLVADKGVLVAGETDAQFESAGTIAQIWGVYVSKDFRDQGIELAMINEAKLKFKALGYSIVALATFSAQEITEVIIEAGFKPLMVHHILSEEAD